MYKFARIDENGMFVEDVVLDHIPDPIDNPDLVVHEVPPGFYHPRWDGEQWVEGLSQEEIERRTNVSIPPNPNYIMGERIVQLELENLQLKEQNNVLGDSLIEIEQRLLQLEGGSE